ncbi:hypothetical protein L3X38_034781 [Prunus dulcis]|uniref:Uncharacterized protein n=1 Tax=Prunus dulcis TaxID=3755 RepID=A0AAD4VK57_PRUDU|nr:hypothetical protein L3X38_034781 [Prunus dulcis]
MATTNSASVSLNLLIDPKTHKVMFAEASKEVVDFLFSFLSLHVATVTRLLSTDGMVGCLGNLYRSAESLVSTPTCHSVLRTPFSNPKQKFLRPISFNCHCRPTMTRIFLNCSTFVSNIKAGYVKGGVVYMIMDNLEVKPMTTESSVAVLQKFNVKGTDALQDKEGLKLVKASSESNTALTNVFL